MGICRMRKGRIPTAQFSRTPHLKTPIAISKAQ
jgi:hypothetical protein